MSILRAGIACENKSWIDSAIEIALHSSKRRDLKENYIIDTCICHGTTGVAHVFNRFFHYTGREEFKNASIYWYMKTFELFDQNEHLDIWENVSRSNTEYAWFREPGLLEGSAGVGLSLISAISDIEPKWDRSLLLS